ncbi:hypothetical protein BGZ50_008165 [Haplosporangium sp. Z 11]|nr:hypothetical protein BGZ50_008165 [Haplosporangium sp. Z 11]
MQHMYCVFGYTGHNGKQVYHSNYIHDSLLIYSSIPRDIDKDVYGDYSSIKSIELYRYKEDPIGHRTYARIFSFQMPEAANRLPMPEFDTFLKEHIYDEPEEEITFDELYFPEIAMCSEGDDESDYNAFY